MTTRLLCVIGKEVRKYRESPALALRVEMPFSRTTATRVPAGTVTLSFAPMRLSVTGRAAGATGGAADACGPSGCCAKAKLDEPSTKRGRTKSERVRFTAIPPCCHAMRPAQLRMPVVYAGSAYQRANPFKRWHLTTRFVRSTLM